MKKHLKTFTIATIVVLLLTVLIISLIVRMASSRAQEDSQINEISGDKVISLEIKQLTQDPRTLKIPVLLAITSSIASDRVEVTWEMPSELKLDGEESFFTEVKANQPKIIQATFSPKKAGRAELGAKVQIFAAEVNYISSVKEAIPIGNDLEVLYEDDIFSNQKTDVQVVNTLRVVAVVAFVLAGVVLGLGLFFRWLNAED
ncbi:MAG TPA: hypothetical protein ENI23_02265 [bacterium]|nr:hypothetical protein [bacterium]